MIRRPPRSTLFPYRRSSDLVPRLVELRHDARHARQHLERGLQLVAANLGHRRDDERSEEHTSELQSQSNLVCRLLLEKKKKSNTNTNLQITPLQQEQLHTRP